MESVYHSVWLNRNAALTLDPEFIRVKNRFRATPISNSLTHQSSDVAIVTPITMK